MKTPTIIIIIVILLCILSSIAGGYYYYTNKKEREKQEKQEALTKIKYNENIDNYNKLYNINYYNRKIYKNNDIKKMKEAEATVISDPIQKQITVNDKILTIYRYNITYQMKDYFKNPIGGITLMDMGEDLTKGIQISSNSMLSYINSDETYKIRTDFISTKPVSKGDKFTVYYDITGIRIAPPFLDEKYVTYFDKK